MEINVILSIYTESDAKTVLGHHVDQLLFKIMSFLVFF